MRKINLIELVQDYLAGGDVAEDLMGRYHYEIVAGHINTAYNKIVFNTYMEAKTYSDYSILDAWCKNYTLTLADVSSNKGRVKLPFPPVQLPNNMGILQVNSNGNISDAYAYRETNSHAVFSKLEVGSVSTKTFFYLEMNDQDETETHVLKFENLPDGITDVDVKMIVPFDRIDDYDTVAMPAGKEDIIMEYVIQLMRTKPPEDTINDRKPEQI
ncbi:MAG TPA: hypothetical protein VJ945_01285 [Flavobacteriaceae bacterium]|nr:hypothetical protein [Balneolales bacterium]HKK11435.1 hypothetical protein [Flavobacteriaceae bacterium]